MMKYPANILIEMYTIVGALFSWPRWALNCNIGFAIIPFEYFVDNSEIKLNSFSLFK